MAVKKGGTGGKKSGRTPPKKPYQEALRKKPLTVKRRKKPDPEKRALLEMAFEESEKRYHYRFELLKQEVEFITGFDPRGGTWESKGAVPVGQLNVVKELVPLLKDELWHLKKRHVKKTKEVAGKISKLEKDLKHAESRLQFYKKRVEDIGLISIAARKEFGPRQYNYMGSRARVKKWHAGRVKIKDPVKLLKNHLHDLRRYYASVQMKVLDAELKLYYSPENRELETSVKKCSAHQEQLRKEILACNEALKKHELAAERAKAKKKKH